MVYAAGHACQKQLWRVWPAAEGPSPDPEEVPPKYTFDSKTDLNKWLKSVGFDPRKMASEKHEDGKYKSVSNETWVCLCDHYLEPEANCLNTVKSMLNGIIEATGAKSYGVYLTAGGGFRKEIYPLYKANRDGSTKPIYYDLMREYMVKHWGATIYDDLEADDAVAMDVLEMQDKHGMDSVCLASIDKDLDQIVGWHYNYNNELDLRANALYFVDADTARRCFFTQLLMGDTSDNIPGIPRVGEKTAPRMLAHCKTLEDYLAVVEKAYADHNAKLPEDEPPLNMELHAELLLMRRKSKDDYWRDFI
jgi:5'-3' exonuclease